jgi:hypothetical protein
MTDHSRRPFYAEYAWAFDVLIDRPVRKKCAAIADWLVRRGVLPGKLTFTSVTELDRLVAVARRSKFAAEDLVTDAAGTATR